jgi:integrase
VSTSSTRGQKLPVATLKPREHLAKDGTRTVFYDAYFFYAGKKVWRRVGPAWLERYGDGWRKRGGRVPAGFYEVRAAEKVAESVREAEEAENAEREWRERGATFREVARNYLRWLEAEYSAKPSTLKDHGYMLAEPGTPRQRGTGNLAGRIMAALGDRSADVITTEEIKALLSKIGDGRSPRTYNKHRNLLSAAFNYGMSDPTGYKLTNNPAVSVKPRREPAPGALIFYTVEEVEAIAQTMTAGVHRDRRRAVTSESELALHAAQDAQDGEAVRLAAYCGLRQGERLELRWKDIDWTASAVKVSRTLSAGKVTTPKSGKVRRVPLADQAAAALERLSQRPDFTAPDELVRCNPVTGRWLDGSTLRKRYDATLVLLELEPLRWHDLRHSCGSLLAAAGIDLVTIKDAMGHHSLKVTERYLHARPATQTAALFTAAFAGSSAAKQMASAVIA